MCNYRSSKCKTEKDVITLIFSGLRDGGGEGKSLGFKEDRAGEAGGRQQASSSLRTASGQGQQVPKLSLHFREVGPRLEGKPG